MLKLNLDGHTFDRGFHKLAVQFFGSQRMIFAKQFDTIMSGRDTYRVKRSQEPSFLSNHIKLGARNMHTVTVLQEGKKVAEFYSLNEFEVARESRAFISGALSNAAKPADTVTVPPNAVIVGLQRKVEEQRKEIVKLKTGGPQGSEIARLKTELRVCRESYAGLQKTYYETLQRYPVCHPRHNLPFQPSNSAWTYSLPQEWRPAPMLEMKQNLLALELRVKALEQKAR